MATDAINLDLDYLDHIKTVRLVCRLGRGSEILPIRLWLFCGKYYAKDGRFTGFSPTEIETAILKWWGKPGVAVETLMDVGFLRMDGGAYIVHDWVEMNGHIEAFRARARTAAMVRWGKMKECPSNAASNAQALPKQSSTYLPTNLPTYLPTKSKESARKFIAPTPLEASEYARSIGFPLDGEQFCAFYASKGWVVGRSPMRNWMAAVRTWKARESGRLRKGGANGKTDNSFRSNGNHVEVDRKHNEIIL